jgi:hypothetical protein
MNRINSEINYFSLYEPEGWNILSDVHQLFIALIGFS